MALSAISERYVHNDSGRVCQGDLVREVSVVTDVVETVSGDEKALETIFRTFPYAVVLSQDCDLEQDFNNRAVESDDADKFLESVLLCPAYQAAKLRKGVHLEDIAQKMQVISSKPWAILEKNDNSRYHFLRASEDFEFPDLVLDFKHYFTIHRNVFYRDHYPDKYIATLNVLFREECSQRFARYLSRIGLPAFPKLQKAVANH